MGLEWCALGAEDSRRGCPQRLRSSDCIRPGHPVADRRRVLLRATVATRRARYDVALGRRSLATTPGHRGAAPGLGPRPESIHRAPDAVELRTDAGPSSALVLDGTEVGAP